MTRGNRPGKRADTTRMKMVSGEGEGVWGWIGGFAVRNLEMARQKLGSPEQLSWRSCLYLYGALRTAATSRPGASSEAPPSLCAGSDRNPVYARLVREWSCVPDSTTCPLQNVNSTLAHATDQQPGKVGPVRPTAVGTLNLGRTMETGVQRPSTQ